MSTFLSQQNTNNTVTLGVNVVPTGAGIQLGGSGVSTPGVGNIVASGITLPSSQLNWNGSSVRGASIYPANLTQLVACGDGIGNDAGPCDTFAMNRNYRTPYVSNWTLGIHHAFAGKLSLDVAYVGNHGTKLAGIRDLNQPPIGGGWTAAVMGAGAADWGAEAAARPFATAFPYLGFINYYSNLYLSNYNGLQATVTARNYHGLDFVLGYTYSHALDDMSYNWNQYLPKNSANPNGEYGNSDFDIKHRFTLSVTYTLPGKKTWGQLLEGWQVNSILTLQSGQPWQTFDTSNDLSGTGEFADRWNFFGSPSDFKSQGQHSIPFFAGNSNPACAAKALSMDGGNASGLADASLNTFDCYANGQSMLLPPAFGTLGNLGRNVFLDTGFHNLDLSISKNWKFKERLTAQFRAEAFNVPNHPTFANPWGGTSGYGAGVTADPSVGPFGCGCATPDVAAVNPVLGSGSARAIQLGLKLTF